METKVCSKCKKNKSLNDFTNDKQKKDGKNSSCRFCNGTTKARQPNIINGEKYCKKCGVKESIDNFYKKCSNCKKCELIIAKNIRNNNLEKYRIIAKNFRINNPGKVSNYNKNYRENNKENIRKCFEEYKKNNPNVIKFNNSACRKVDFDSYIVMLLSKSTGVQKEILKQMPELIQQKRLIIKIKNLLKK